jgi:hypothetical protein
MRSQSWKSKVTSQSIQDTQNPYSQSLTPKSSYHLYTKVTFSAALRTPLLHFPYVPRLLQLSLSLCDELAPLLTSNHRRSRISCGRGTTCHLNSDHTTEWACGVAICDLDKTSIGLTAHCTAAGSTSWDLHCERLLRQY